MIEEATIYEIEGWSGNSMDVEERSQASGAWRKIGISEERDAVLRKESKEVYGAARDCPGQHLSICT